MSKQKRRRWEEPRYCKLRGCEDLAAPGQAYCKIEHSPFGHLTERKSAASNLEKKRSSSNADIYWVPGLTLKDAEKNVICDALKFYKGNRAKTALAIGVSEKTLRNKIKRYEISTEKER